MKLIQDAILSRRGVLTASAIAAIGLTAAQLIGPTDSASAAVIWGHPLPKQGHISYRGPAMRSGKMHWGTDYDMSGFLAPPTVYAVATGTVVGRAATEHPGYGYYVEIQHSNGWTTLYGHLYAPSQLRTGDAITRGTPVGTMGNTGASYGTHLHIELRQTLGLPDSSIDSYPYIHDAPLPNGETMAITDADAVKIAAAILEWDSPGGDPLPDGGVIPRETISERLRQIRRQLHYGWNRIYDTKVIALRLDDSLRYGKTGTDGYSDGKTTTMIKDTNLRVAALTAAVQAMATNQGITASQLQTAVNTAVTNAVANLPTTAP